MRRALDGLYRACGVAAGLFLILIAVAVLTLIVGRLLAGPLDALGAWLAPLVGSGVAAAWDASLGGLIAGFYAGGQEIAGFAMAASAFLGLASALRAGAHIRVGLLLGRLPARARPAAEALTLLLALFLVGQLAWASAEMALESRAFNERSDGLLNAPLWIPQLAMAFGAAVLVIALLDELATVLRGRTPSYEAAGETSLESERLGAAPGR